MALIECNFFSETLGLSTAMNVILPEATSGQIGMTGTVRGGAGHPTLYLLHGLSDDHTIWLRRTSIERYVASLGLAVVMPAVHRSFYADMAHGGRYWTFVSEELPRVARAFFPLSDRREDTYVAGLSMGGYGAFKLALNCPDRFSAAASLSGALCLEVNDDPEPDGGYGEDLRRAFGSRAAFVGSENDLCRVAATLSGSGAVKPRLYQCCGTEDGLLDQNHAFRSLVEPLGFDYTYEEEPGTHEWGYWDLKIQRVLSWLSARS